MTAERRYLNLNAYLRNSGYHEAAWRISPADPAIVLDPRHYIDLARTAERGVLDSIFLPDSPGGAEFRSEYLPGAGLDPLQLLSSLATATDQVGLIATVSTTYSYPWDTARRLATLDFLSHGRAGWNIVTTVEPAVAGNFGDQPHPPAADRYGRAGEYVEVVLELWDAWEDDAAIVSRSTGRWADPAKLHPPRHHGPYFDVSSYLPFPRSPQGHPFLTQAGSSPPGIALAARYADAVFTPLAGIAKGAAFRENLRSQAAGFGRDPSQVRVLPSLSFLLAGSDAEAAALKDELETAASGEFRWPIWPTWPGWTTPPSIPTRRSRRNCWPPRPRRASVPRSISWPPKNRASRSGPSPGSYPPCPAGWTSPAPRRAWPSSSLTGGRPVPPTGSPSCRTSCPASWTHSSTRLYRSCKSAASPGPNTPGPPCATTPACPAQPDRPPLPCRKRPARRRECPPQFGQLGHHSSSNMLWKCQI